MSASAKLFLLRVNSFGICCTVLFFCTYAGAWVSPTTEGRVDLTSKLLRTIPGEYGTFDSRSNKLLVAGVASATVWDADTAGILFQLDGYDNLNDARFTTDGLSIVTIGKEHIKKGVTTKIWSAADGRLEASLPGYAVFVGTSSSDSEAITIHDDELKLWDVTNGKLIKTVPARTKVHSDWQFFLDSVISPNGRYIVSYRGKSVTLWDTHTGNVIAVLKPADSNLSREYAGRDSEIYRTQFSANSELIATIDSLNRIEVWQSSTGKLKHVLIGHLDSIYDLEFSADSRLLASASRDGTARVWELEAGHSANIFRTDNNIPRRLEFDLQSKLLAVAYQDGAKIWDLKTTLIRGQLSKTGNTKVIRPADSNLNAPKFCFSPDGKTLLTLTEKTLDLWETRDGRFVGTLDGAKSSGAFSRDGNFLVTKGSNSRVLLWKITRP